MKWQVELELADADLDVWQVQELTDWLVNTGLDYEPFAITLNCEASDAVSAAQFAVARLKYALGRAKLDNWAVTALTVDPWRE